MDVITTVNGLSKLSVSAHAAGQQTAKQETAKFTMKTDRVEVDAMSGFSDQIDGLPKSRCADCAQIVPRFEYRLPGSAESPILGLTAASYEVQNTLVYDMILPESRTSLQCIVKAEQVSWSSDPVLVPTDVSGNTVFQRIRTDVDRFAFTSCPLLSVVYLLFVRELQTDVVVVKLEQGQTLTIRMSFDPTVREEITAKSVDAFTGASSAASCVRWDEDLRMWSSEGIEHVDVHLGAANGTGAYVECKTSWLGTFAVSEVPRDCRGVVMGTTFNDLCGVCGGDNSTCSGCDGEPNSGRTKACSGHGGCNASGLCECEPGYHGVDCQVLCEDRVNCSGFGRCDVTFEGLSMQTAVQCQCNEGYRKTSEEYNLRPVSTCEFIIVEKWELPEAAKWSLAIGVPLLVITCTVWCFLRWLAMREARFVRAMKKDVDSYSKYYLEENEPIKLGHMEVNADLCVVLPAEDGEEDLPVELSSRVRNEHVGSGDVLREIEDLVVKKNQNADELRTALPEVDSSAPPMMYGIVSPFEDHEQNHPAGSEGVLHGVLTSRIEKYESRDWRQGLLRDNMSRFNTAAKRASQGPKGSDEQEEVAV